MAATFPDEGRRRAVIDSVEPEVGEGRFAAKRVEGDELIVEADVYADGHDELAAVLRYRAPGGGEWREEEMEPLGNDRWRGSFRLSERGRWLYTITAWVDPFRTWRSDLEKRLDAGQEVGQELLTGAALVEEAARRADGPDRDELEARAAELRSLAVAPERGGPAPDGAAAGGPAAGGTEDAPTRPDGAVSAERAAGSGGGAAPAAADDVSASPSGARRALDRDLADLMGRYPDRSLATEYGRELPVVADRERARFSAWYELFPRSAAPEPDRHGTFADVEKLLPYVADMGFDVLYLPPIHPIGRTGRKGPDDAGPAGPEDPGSPWAIGSEEGGHKAVHPRLGTLDDFRRLRRRAEEAGLEIALDIAFQCSPDHPYVREHPEWFRSRPDGSIRYAENPPKKYEDIYPLDFETDAWPELWRELKSVFSFWIGQGVRIFRVDNPHTKPFPFWEWLIGEIRAEHPDVIFLSEAFTRPKVMYRLAKIGFSQSYTYFAWRHGKDELREYVEELTTAPVREFFRPNFWPNTPDILTEHLRTGGRAAFMGRFVLAATLSSSYGIYGPAFELQADDAREEGSEEYLGSEKYEIRQWDLGSEESLRPFVARVNRIRRGNPALQRTDNVRFHATDDESLLAYSKATPDLSNVLLVVVNLDPHRTRSGWVDLEAEALGIGEEQDYTVHDRLAGGTYRWSGTRNYVELDPEVSPAHVFEVAGRVRREHQAERYA